MVHVQHTRGAHGVHVALHAAWAGAPAKGIIYGLIEQKAILAELLLLITAAVMGLGCIAGKFVSILFWW